MASVLVKLFEAALTPSADGLSVRVQKNASLNSGSVSDRLQEKKPTASASTTTSNFKPTRREQIATALTWTKQATEGSLVTHPGVYCLQQQ